MMISITNDSLPDQVAGTRGPKAKGPGAWGKGGEEMRGRTLSPVTLLFTSFTLLTLLMLFTLFTVLTRGTQRTQPPTVVTIQVRVVVPVVRYRILLDGYRFTSSARSASHYPLPLYSGNRNGISEASPQSAPRYQYCIISTLFYLTLSYPSASSALTFRHSLSLLLDAVLDLLLVFLTRLLIRLRLSIKLCRVRPQWHVIPWYMCRYDGSALTE